LLEISQSREKYSNILKILAVSASGISSKIPKEEGATMAGQINLKKRKPVTP